MQTTRKLSNHRQIEPVRVLPIRVISEPSLPSIADTRKGMPAPIPSLNRAVAFQTPDFEARKATHMNNTSVGAAVRLTDCAISDPAVMGNLRLVADCTTLLKSRDILNPSGNRLNWSIDLPMTEWKGIGIAEGRVTSLEGSGGRLSGTIPAELGMLTNPKELSLDDNGLTGSIPTSWESSRI